MDKITNYPLGVDGTHPHFNEPDPPECQNRKCCATLEYEWEWCPYCGWHISWEDWDAKRGEWR